MYLKDTKAKRKGLKLSKNQKKTNKHLKAAYMSKRVKIKKRLINLMKSINNLRKNGWH